MVPRHRPRFPTRDSWTHSQNPREVKRWRFGGCASVPGIVFQLFRSFNTSLQQEFIDAKRAIHGLPFILIHRFRCNGDFEGHIPRLMDNRSTGKQMSLFFVPSYREPEIQKKTRFFLNVGAGAVKGICSKTINQMVPAQITKLTYRWRQRLKFSNCTYMSELGSALVSERVSPLQIWPHRISVYHEILSCTCRDVWLLYALGNKKLWRIAIRRREMSAAACEQKLDD